MGKALVWNGKSLYQEGAYLVYDVSKLEGVVSGDRGAVILIGKGERGEPGKLVFFSNFKDMADYYHSGSLADFARLAFYPSKDPNVGLPTYVVGAKINSSTAGSATLVKEGVSYINFTSKIFGNCPITVEVKIGSQEDTSWDLIINTPEESEKLSYNLEQVAEYEAFSIRYVGQAPNATISIDDTKLSITVDEETTEFPFAIYSTVKALGDAIQAKYGNDVVIQYSLPGKEFPHTKYCDKIVSQDIATRESYVSFLCYLFKQYVNKTSKYISMEYVSLAQMNPYELYNTDMVLSLNGTVSDDTTMLEEVLNSIKSFPYDLPVAVYTLPCSVTPEGALPTELTTLLDFVTEYNSMLSKRGIQLYCGIKANSRDEILNIPTKLNSPYVCATLQDASFIDSKGNLNSNYGSVPLAVCAGAIRAGSIVGEPLTYKTINLISVSPIANLGYPADILIKMGWLLADTYTSGIRFKRGVTTYIQSENQALIQESVICEMIDFKIGLIRTIENAFLGKKGLPLVVNNLKDKVIQYCNSKVNGYEAILAPTLDSNGVMLPPYRNIEVKLEGETCYVSLEVSFVFGITFIPITITVTAPGYKA